MRSSTPLPRTRARRGGCNEDRRQQAIEPGNAASPAGTAIGGGGDCVAPPARGLRGVVHRVARGGGGRRNAGRRGSGRAKPGGEGRGPRAGARSRGRSARGAGVRERFRMRPTDSVLRGRPLRVDQSAGQRGTSPSGCPSGYCVDGVCRIAAGCPTCEACGSTGSCAPAERGTSCTTAHASASACDGQGACGETQCDPGCLGCDGNPSNGARRRSASRTAATAGFSAARTTSRWPSTRPAARDARAPRAARGTLTATVTRPTAVIDAMAARRTIICRSSRRSH